MKICVCLSDKKCAIIIRFMCVCLSSVCMFVYIYFYFIILKFHFDLYCRKTKTELRNTMNFVLLALQQIPFPSFFFNLYARDREKEIKLKKNESKKVKINRIIEAKEAKNV